MYRLLLSLESGGEVAQTNKHSRPTNISQSESAHTTSGTNQERVIHATFHLYKRSQTHTPTDDASDAQLASSVVHSNSNTNNQPNQLAVVDSVVASTPNNSLSAPSSPSRHTSTTPTAALNTVVPTDAHQSRQLLILAVPASLTTEHLICHLIELSWTNVEACTRIIHPTSHQHSLLLTFHTSSDARTCYQRLQNHTFHPLRREIAYLFYIGEGDIEERPADADSSLQTLPPNGYLELPSCPRCLSKLDSSVTDIVTELDEFSMVRMKQRTKENKSPLTWTRRCIPIWPEVQCSTCQLAAHANPSTATCQHCQTSTLPSATASAAPLPVASCPQPPPPSSLVTASGDDTNSLWICLLCSHVGCGRYASSGGQHAFSHFQSTRHNYAMEYTMGYIWDYVNDGYIHRVHGHSYRKNSLAQGLTFERKDDLEEQKSDLVPTNPDSTSVTLDPELIDWPNWNDLPSQLTNAPHPTRTSSAGFSLTPDTHSSLHPDSDTNHLLAAASDGDDPLNIPDYGLDVEEESALLHSKLESIATFYNELLNETLRRQYEYFMEKSQEMQEEDERQRNELEPKLAAEIEVLQGDIQVLNSSLTDLDGQNKSLDRSVKELTGKVTRLSEENAFMKELNRNLLADQMARKKKEKEEALHAPVANSSAASLTAALVTTAAVANSSASSATAAQTVSVTAATPSPSLTPSPMPPLVPSTPSSASLSSSVVTSSSPSPLLDFDPSLVAKYSNLRDEKAKRITALEKEVARLMEAMEQRTKKEQAIQEQAEAARKQRIHKSQATETSSTSSSRGRRG